MNGFSEGSRFGSNGPEGTADRRHFRSQRIEFSVNAHPAILENPAHDDGIADGKHQGANDGDGAEYFTETAAAGTFFGGHAEGTHRAGCGHAAECKLFNDARGTNEQHKEQIGQNER